MEIRIDSGIPLPPEGPRFGELLKKLEVHNGKKSKSSFAVNDPDQWTKLRNAVSNTQRDTEMRFMTRKVRERDGDSKKLIDVLRVWRIK